MNGAEMWQQTKTGRDRIEREVLNYIIKRCLKATRRDKLRREQIWNRVERTQSSKFQKTEYLSINMLSGWQNTGRPKE